MSDGGPASASATTEVAPTADGGATVERSPSVPPSLPDLIGRQRTLLAGSALLTVLGALATLIPYVVVYLIAVDAFDGDGLGRARTLRLAGAAGAAVVGQIALKTLATYGSHVAAYRVLADVRHELAERLAAMPIGRVRSRRSGELKKVLQDDVEQLELGLAHAIPDAASAVAVPVASLGVMFWIDWRMGLGAVAVVIISIALLGVGASRAGGLATAASMAKSDLSSAVVSYLRGMAVVRGFTKGRRGLAQVDEAIAEEARVDDERMRRGRVAVVAGTTLVGTASVILVPLGLLLVDRGTLEPTEFAFFALVGVAFAQPLVGLGLTMAVLQYQIEAGAKSIGAILAEPDLPRPGSPLAPVGHTVLLDDVTFAYREQGEHSPAGGGEDDEPPEERPPALRRITLEIPEGSSVALVGASGAGKSTLLRLLARFHDVSAGSIRVGGVDVRHQDPADLMRRIAYVQQDDHLFADTVMENIRLARPTASDDEVIEAARSARVLEIVDGMEDGWRTQLGSGGRQLSGGQRQRISLARAFLKRSDIVLLDEATAFLDPESDEAIGQAVAELRRGRTVVTVAHRLSSITDYDTIVVLDGGRIDACGPHETLLETSRRYRSMWDAYRQTLGWRLSGSGPAPSPTPTVVSEGTAHDPDPDPSPEPPMVDDLRRRNVIDQWLALLGRHRRSLWRRGLWRIVLEGMLTSAPLPVLYFALLAVLDGDGDPPSPALYGAALLAIYLARWSVGVGVAATWWPVATEAVADLRRSVLAHLRRIPLGAFQRMSPGRLTALVGSDLPLVDFINLPARAISGLIQPVLATVVLLLLDWPVALAALAGLPLFAGLLAWSDRVEHNTLGALIDQRQRAAADLLEFVEGTAVLRAHPDAPQASRYERSVEELRHASVRAAVRITPIVAVARSVLEAGFAAVLAVGAVRVLSGDLTASTYLLLMVFAFSLYRPFQELIDLTGYRHLQGRIASNVAEVWETPELPEGRASLGRAQGEVDFDGVSFSYGDVPDRPTLHNMSFCARPGTVTALVGPSGAGKSTVANLIARFWDVDEGAVRIDGVDVRNLSNAALSDAVTSVYQDVFLFPDTVRANVTLGAPDADDAEVRAALEAAQVWEVVADLPRGLDTVIGDGGAQLSGGEEQRLSIARALLKDAPILVLDEAVAAVDPETEVRIQAAISSLAAGRTVFVVAHRLNTIADADRIVVLDRGRLDGVGSHDELVETSATYRRIWSAHERSTPG
ncbi:MAG: ABC transporter ATP-binding protein [Actinomycetota bacterium]